MNTEYASVEELTADEVTGNSEDVTLPNGKRVLIRGMSRYEIQQAGKGTEDGSLVEARMLSACILKPQMTVAQVQAMQKGKGPNFLKDAVLKMRELSGLNEGADKSNVAEVRD